jgi:hypothetical protein
MKLQTDIRPRRDGTVIVRSADGQTFAFAPDGHGELVGEVDDDAVVEQLLAGGLFFPAEPDAEAAAEAAPRRRGRR